MAECVWAGKAFEGWDEYVDEVVQVGAPVQQAQQSERALTRAGAQVDGHELRIAKRNLEREDGDWVDPMFFAEDYTVAAATGFQVWEGARAVVKLLEEEDSALAADLRGRRVLELGSGTGLAGLSASVIGGDVLLTDLPTVTDYSLRPNIAKNAAAAAAADSAGAGAATRQARSCWPEGHAVGRGSAACMSLDWTADVPSQAAAAGVDLGKVEVLLAAECVWLVELVNPFVATVLALLRASAGSAGSAAGGNGGSSGAICYCCYRDRASDQSAHFAGMAAVVEAFEAQGCSVELVRRMPPLEQALLGGGGGDILLYRIRAQE